MHQPRRIDVADARQDLPHKAIKEKMRAKLSRFGALRNCEPRLDWWPGCRGTKSMNRRQVLTGGLSSLVVSPAGGAEVSKPQVPKWRPSFSQPIDRIEERFGYYFDRGRDFAILENGTCVLTEAGLSDEAAAMAAIQTLAMIYNYHPDMKPSDMDDGNVLVSYNHPAFNVVLSDVANAHWQEIEARHQDGLATGEVLITPLGQNVFDELGKKALLGRCYMFMDAQAPKVIRIKPS
ncbi:hypothetical protein [Mesorhizobium sp. M0589]